MSRCLLVALVCTAACRPPAASDRLAAGRWVDLSHAFDSTTIYWPTAQAFRLEVVSAQRTPAGYYYAANNFSAAEHGGTHLDAPVHFAEGRWTTDQIPLDRLIGDAVVLDLRGAVAREGADLQITPVMLAQLEDSGGSVKDKIVLLFTGWGSRWPDRARYLGTVRTGQAAVAELHFPGIHPTAARWLKDRGVKAVGIDTPSLDYGQSATFDTHRLLFEANIPGFENLANLESLPPRGAFVVALPMKIRGGSGGPLRIVALRPAGPSGAALP